MKEQRSESLKQVQAQWGSSLNEHLPWVRSMARRFVGKGLELEELVHEGYFGLLRAARRFDPDFGASFKTYAQHWVMQAIVRAIANQGRVIRLPVHIREALARYKREQGALAVELQRAPTQAELAAALEIPPQRLSTLQQMTKMPLLLGDTVNEAASGGYESPEEGLIRQQWLYGLQRALAGLRERERYILKHRFGLGADEKTLAELGGELKVSAERVRQLESTALKALRGALMYLRDSESSHASLQ